MPSGLPRIAKSKSTTINRRVSGTEFGGFAGANLKQALIKIGDGTIEIIKRSGHAKSFTILPRRWVIERTFAWPNRNRHLAKDFENTVAAAAWLFMASVSHLARCIAN